MKALRTVEVCCWDMRAGVPMYQYFPPGSAASDGQLLPQIFTPGLLADAVSNPDQRPKND